MRHSFTETQIKDRKLNEFLNKQTLEKDETRDTTYKSFCIFLELILKFNKITKKKLKCIYNTGSSKLYFKNVRERSRTFANVRVFLNIRTF